jgi:hypothetical protein
VLTPEGSYGNQIVEELLMCQQCAGVELSVEIVMPSVSSFPVVVS